jgi:hypothetical protein
MAALRGEHDETVPASLPGPSPGVLQALHDSGDTRDRLLAAQLLLAPKEVSLDYKKHYVRGVAYVTAISEQDIDDLQEKFMPRDTDVFVTTYPKCGTTWMQQICVLLKQGIASGSGHIDPGQKVDIGKESPWIDMSYPKLSLDDMQAMGNPRIFKTHAPFQLMPSQRDVVTGLPAEGKVVYVARNPKDACVSQFHHARCDEPPPILDHRLAPLQARIAGAQLVLAGALTWRCHTMQSHPELHVRRAIWRLGASLSGRRDRTRLVVGPSQTVVFRRRAIPRACLLYRVRGNGSGFGRFNHTSREFPRLG